MHKKLAGKLNYANVMATLALFVALGGSSYAAVTLAKNSVGSAQLKKNAVTNSKIKNSAVTSAKIKKANVTESKLKDSAVTGAKIKDATIKSSDIDITNLKAGIGQVDSAKKADSATSAETATTATTASNVGGKTAAQLTLSCPTSTSLVAGLCYESVPRAAATFSTAIGNCANAGGSLAQAIDLVSASGHGITLSSSEKEWSGSITGTGPFEVITVNSTGPASTISVSDTTTPLGYRCAYRPSQSS